MKRFSIKKNTQKAWGFPGLLALFLMGGLAYPAFAQSDWDTNNRLKRIENEIETLSRAIYRGEKPPPGAFQGGASGADTEIRLQQIETEMRDLRGKLEEQAYEIRQLKTQFERVSSDLELRMNDVEGGSRGNSGAINTLSTGGTRYTTQRATSTSTMGAGASTSSGNDGYQWNSNNSTGASTSGQLGSYSASSGGGDLAAATYENAFAMIKSRKYDAAEAEFQTFLRDYPTHPLAGNAKYWLGESYYVRGNFETAARIFAEGYKEFPKGSKAADNLLKLALSLDALGKQGDACVALRQLKKENPAGAVPVLRRADQELSRLGC